MKRFNKKEDCTSSQWSAGQCSVFWFFNFIFGKWSSDKYIRDISDPPGQQFCYLYDGRIKGLRLAGLLAWTRRKRIEIWNISLEEFSISFLNLSINFYLCNLQNPWDKEQIYLQFILSHFRYWREDGVNLNLNFPTRKYSKCSLPSHRCWARV